MSVSSRERHHSGVEAVYMIEREACHETPTRGYDGVQKRYVLHALDVHGAAGPRVAYGSRQGDQIRFEAEAGRRTVGMRLTWRPESGTWRTVWGSQPAGGEWQAVTDLVLTRAK